MADHVSLSVPDESTCVDDDGRPKRSGTVWTASAHIITAVIGSRVLSLPWATAQLGWIAGPSVLLLFSAVTYYTCSFLSDCYRTGDQLTGIRNYTYMDVVRSNLGDVHVKICGVIQYVNLVGVAIGYTIASSISMVEVKRSNCFHKNGHDHASCNISSTPYKIMFGVLGIVLSQILNFDKISWLSIAAALMSFTYKTIGLGLGVVKVVQTGKIQGSISIGTEIDKVWKSFQALGAIASAYSYSLILIEIQDTLIKSPSAEAKTMKKATQISLVVTTVLYMLCGCFGYAAFGDQSPENLLTGFGFDDPYWLLDIANVAVIIHLVGAYQVSCQTLFAFVEKKTGEWYPDSNIITKEIDIPIHCCKPFKLNFFRLIWRTIFVITTTFISVLIPSFNNIADILGAFAFWPLTVYFPIKMYIVKNNIPKWSGRWICLQLLGGACLVISIAAAVGSFAGLVSDLKAYKPFK
ncbi:amino acid permease 3-like [Solanum stenotomum]|uniref:amino acid permease 3-like n=1 Tax=Solanum stenotomum TaxID=172797 RepID=UPI0020D107E7|nr:amino acid permease 3-like [Solanum stenotomum]